MNWLQSLNRFSNTHPLIKPIKYEGVKHYHNLSLAILMGVSHRTDYKILGLQRSGNHALIQWIFSLTKGLTCFCNDIAPGQHPKEAPIKKTKWGSLSRGSLLYSYEDRTIKDTFFPDKEFSITLRKKPVNSYKILVLRDPYNMFASRWNQDSPNGKKFREDLTYRDKLLSLWKEYAYILRKDSALERKDILGISFNKWISSTAYREKIAECLGLQFEHAQVQLPIWGFGGGSSFEGLDQQATPHKMNVQERWKTVALLPEFEKWAKDPELRDLSQKVLGVGPYQEAKAYEDRSMP